MSRAKPRVGVRDIYKLGVRLKVEQASLPLKKSSWLLHIFRHPTLLLKSLTPIDYVRYREFEFALSALNSCPNSPGTVLDLSSPKLLPLTIAASFPETPVYATDILPAESLFVEKSAKSLRLTNVIPEIQDCRALRYPDASFDVITSLSVFEHIAPEQDGEIPAVKELARVLAPHGIAILTVPFSKKYFAEYRTGRVYERISSETVPIFFQRFYDYDLLLSNIIQASGLSLLYLGCIEERYFFQDPHKRLAHYINSTRRQTMVFGIWFPVLARIFLSAPQPLDVCRKPYIACIVLKKS
ncbi:methyltransferase domain-containing protein [candidate division KSB3 bacterium]|uniref:Methyltransferase domain-containing protein n=1 Tax=candidate division KSB3 bacterium TaxID=2044937 RepID=A0A9D5JUQ6_9BACT|nr:methyltransferase domain-containing protein [candidate division KSB3 bacterium]MBD3324026.1 methyltransferase domain-containing protein [candidate division KSB3 bacterium]